MGGVRGLIKDKVADSFTYQSLPSPDSMVQVAQPPCSDITFPRFISLSLSPYRPRAADPLSKGRIKAQPPFVLSSHTVTVRQTTSNTSS